MSFIQYFREMVSSGTLEYVFMCIDSIFLNPMVYYLVCALVSSFAIFIVCRLVWG